MKVFFFSLIPILHSFFPTTAFAALKDDIIPVDTEGNFSSLTSADGLGALDVLLGFFRDSIFGLLALIFISLMIYVGVRLFMARGNEEEYAKALWTFLYAGIGMVIVLLSYAAVRLIVGLSL